MAASLKGSLDSNHRFSLQFVVFSSPSIERISCFCAIFNERRRHGESQQRDIKKHCNDLSIHINITIGERVMCCGSRSEIPDLHAAVLGVPSLTSSPRGATGARMAAIVFNRALAIVACATARAVVVSLRPVTGT